MAGKGPTVTPPFVSLQEEMDLKVLQFKNKKLAERLEQRQACEDDLRERIEKLEKRQATDDATLLIVHRYWGQVPPLPLPPGSLSWGCGGLYLGPDAWVLLRPHGAKG